MTRTDLTKLIPRLEHRTWRRWREVVVHGIVMAKSDGLIPLHPGVEAVDPAVPVLLVEAAAEPGALRCVRLSASVLNATRSVHRVEFLPGGRGWPDRVARWVAAQIDDIAATAAKDAAAWSRLREPG